MKSPIPDKKLFFSKKLQIIQVNKKYKDTKRNPLSKELRKERNSKIKEIEDSKEALFVLWLRKKRFSEVTIMNYVNTLRTFHGEVDIFLTNPNLKNPKNKIKAYRSYLKFLCKSQKIIEKVDLIDLLDEYKLPKKRGNNQNEKLRSITEPKWENTISKAPNVVAKMSIYLAFEFGLRNSEIRYLRIRDINFSEKEINICIHKDKNGKVLWSPKYNRERTLPFTDNHAIIFNRWISERAKLNLKHDYLLYTNFGARKGKILRNSMFTKWFNSVGITPHICRYSFATHYYKKSKDLKLISDLLGHSNVSTTSNYLKVGHEETMNQGRKLMSSY